MLYEVNIKNPTGENIYRAKNSIKAESKLRFVTDEAGFRELRACSNLIIEKLLFVCPHCKKVFDKKKGLFTHVNMAHPEHSHNFNKE